MLVAVLVLGYTANALRDRGTAAPAATTQSASAPPAGGTVSSSANVALSTLPPQVTDTVRLIELGGPFPYRQDGVVFANLERRLPIRQRGYYHEYTVRTPGSPDRGARRIIIGQNGQYYYTPDHYETFVPVDVAR